MVGSTIVFWVSQAVALLGLAAFTWISGAFFDRVLKERVKWAASGSINGLVVLSRPVLRACRFAFRAYCRFIDRVFPSWAHAPGRQEAFVTNVLVGVLVGFLVRVHVTNCAAAAADTGLQRLELPQLAAGAIALRWNGLHCVRPQDGVLPQGLAALPLWASERAPATARWLLPDGWWPSPQWPPPERWASVEAAAVSRRARLGGECDSKGDGLWSAGRALLWGASGRRAGGAGTSGVTSGATSAADLLPSEAEEAASVAVAASDDAANQDGVQVRLASRPLPSAALAAPRSSLRNDRPRVRRAAGEGVAARRAHASGHARGGAAAGESAVRPR